MKITASKGAVTAGRREDIIKQRDEWDSQWKAANAKSEEEHDQFREAQYAITDPIQEKLEKDLSQFDKINIRVRVDPWGAPFGSKHPIGVHIDADENEKFEDTSALAWNFDVYLTSAGEVVKSTGSWSGLKATTPEQLDSLRETLSALEYLNGLDWASIINKEMPNIEDYMKTTVPKRSTRPNFEQQLMEVDLEDLVGANKVVKVENWEGSGYRGKYAWVQLVRETPAGYTIRVRGDWNDDDVKTWLRRAIDQNFATQRMRKSSLKPVKPLQTLDPASDEELEAWNKRLEAYKNKNNF